MRGTLKFNEPLAPYTSWRIGGPADRYYRPADMDDLADFLKTLSPNEPITWLGLGSNVLISDAGIRGVVIHLLFPGTLELLDSLTPSHQKTVRVEAGMTCAKLAKFCAKQGLVGAEFFSGIPGTVGGALFMNAGAWGSETWEHVVRVETINRLGERFVRFPKDYQVGYRSVVAAQVQEWFVSGYFQFEQGETAQSTAKIKALLRERGSKQPIGTFSCGSVFQNPKGHYAGQLIEASKLKAYTIGGAKVSSKHANFILNQGNATASDVLALIQYVQKVVLREHEIALKTEVKMLGFQPIT